MTMIPDFTRGKITFTQAAGIEDLCECLHLRYKVYCEEIGFNVKEKDSSSLSDMLAAMGHDDPYPDQYEFDKNDFIEDYLKEEERPAAHFTAWKDYSSASSEAVGTIRIIEDSEAGLPMEPDYRLDRFRSGERKIAEVSRLINIGNPSVLSGLFRCVMRYAYENDVDDIFVTSQPDYLDFYRGIALYPVDEPFEYTKLGGPWVPLRMDVNKVFDLSYNVVKYMCSPIPEQHTAKEQEPIRAPR